MNRRRVGEERATPLNAATLEEVSGTHHPLLYLPHTH
jgi:hypothetical protein